MLMEFGQIIVVIVMVSLAAIGWSDVVTQEGMILGVIRKIKMPVWIAKPLYLCAFCVAGQMGLWWYVANHWTFNLFLLINAGIGLTFLIKSKL